LLGFTVVKTNVVDPLNNHIWPVIRYFDSGKLHQLAEFWYPPGELPREGPTGLSETEKEALSLPYGLPRIFYFTH
jgi:hypothetical protein